MLQPHRRGPGCASVRVLCRLRLPGEAANLRIDSLIVPETSANALHPVDWAAQATMLCSCASPQIPSQHRLATVPA